VSAEASDLVSIPRAELEALKAELKRLRREVGRGAAVARIQADPGLGDDAPAFTRCCRPRCLHMVRQQFLLMKRQRSVSLNPKAGSPGAGACPWGQIDVTRGPARIRPGAAAWPARRRQGGRDPPKRPGRRARGTLMRMAISAPPHMAFANRHGPRSGEAG
jgi:hypothetical protein